MINIDWSDFEKVELRAGTIVTAAEFPEARNPAYKLEIDFGSEIGILQSSAQITDYYAPQDLVGKQIIAVVNFPDKQIGPFISQCLTTGIYDDAHKVVLVRPDKEVPNGARLV
jgi:tRNA-binding protein